MKPRSHSLLTQGDTALILLDLQEPFLRNIHESHRLIDRCTFLLKCASVMKVPVIATTQYSERMGPIVPSVLEHLPQKTAIIDKLTFSAAAGDQFTTELAQLGREHIIVCGLETHICVCQTALDLAHLDYRVHCAIDAVSSRTIEQHSLGVDRMRDCGIFSVGSEAAVMEMLYSAENDDFRSILKLIK